MLFFRTNCSCMLIWVFDVGCRSFFSSHIFLVPIILTKQPITIKCWRCFQRGWVDNFGTDDFMLLFRFQIIRVCVWAVWCVSDVFITSASRQIAQTQTQKWLKWLQSSNNNKKYTWTRLKTVSRDRVNNALKPMLNHNHKLSQYKTIIIICSNVSVRTIVVTMWVSYQYAGEKTFLQPYSGSVYGWVCVCVCACDFDRNGKHSTENNNFETKNVSWS